MAVFIRGKQVITSGLGNNVGFFTGQNIQQGWDSTGPVKVTTGFSMGDYSYTPCFFAGYLSYSHDFQPIWDNDDKDNQIWSRIR